RLELRRSAVDLAAVLRPIAEQRTILARSRRIDLGLDVAAGARAEIDTDLIARVIENLLDNAFRYTPPGARIAIAARPSRDRGSIEVGNSGPPIPPEARALIFEKFGQAAPTNGRMNLGLGLYFCRLVIERHGGR